MARGSSVKFSVKKSVMTKFVVGVLCLQPQWIQAETLSLNQYLEQVQGTSPSVQSNKFAAEGALQASKEGDLQYIPKLSVLANTTRDERLFGNSLLAGKTSSNNLVLGVEEQFRFGLNAKLSYNLMNNSTTGLIPQLFPGGALVYTVGQTELDLNFPLWRNLFGSENQATEIVAEASSLATKFSSSFQSKVIAANAEAAYYKLGITRETVRLLQQVLDRSQQILKWNSKRVAQRLTDRADELQSQAAYQSKLLDLETGLDDQRTAQLSFNALRNQVSNTVTEELTPISTAEILALSSPQKTDERDDLKAAEQNDRVIRANHELAKQKATPDLSIYSQIAYNGVDRYLSPAMSESFSAQHPLYVVGVKFTFPIYFWETSDIRVGRMKEMSASEADLRQKRLDQSQAWEDLNRKFEAYKKKLLLADSLVKMQDEKLKYERYRFNLGRTTTYYVLTFEQDYTLALITRLKIEQDLLNTYSQLKTFAKD